MNSASPTLKPVAQTGRITHLDILRGIAILFIFLANTASFTGWVVLTPEERLGIDDTGISEFTSALMLILVDGKWYSIFSLLFGIGFAIQYDRVIQKGGNFPSFFSRRMLGLLLIGLVHLVFVWMGDILTIYALLGLVLILFRNVKSRALLWWSGVLILLPILHEVLLPYLNFYPMVFFQKMSEVYLQYGIPMGPTAPLDAPHPLIQYIANEDFGVFVGITPSNALARLAFVLLEGRFFKVLGIFILGLWAGRQILQNDLLNNHKLLFKILWIGLAIGLTFNVARWWLEMNYTGQDYLPQTAAYAFGVVPLAMAYAAGTVLLINRGWKFLNYFQAVGKMALTCYLMQSLISILIYYGIGMGIAHSLPEWMSLSITLGLFALQMIFCNIYIKYFNYGPLEWVWRKMTYGKLKRE